MPKTIGAETSMTVKTGRLMQMSQMVMEEEAGIRD